MSKQRYVDTKFWSDNFIVDLNPLDRYLFLYLLTNEHTNIAGIYELPLIRMAQETGIDKEMLPKMFKRLDEKVRHIDGWVVIKNFQKHQQGSDKIKLGIQSIMDGIPNKIKDFYEKWSTKKDRVSIGYDRVSIGSELLNSNINSNSNIIIPSPNGDAPSVVMTHKKEYGNPSINALLVSLREMNGGAIDGSEKENRRYAHLFLEKLKGIVKNGSVDDGAQYVLAAVRESPFHSKNATSMRYIYNNLVKIIAEKKNNKYQIHV